ncbi:hypothetical protein [uncultured Draconibacterium sp.]|uniref:hypothetical protein n=1 Tax=uncultured Draconibacterium sp. TaxID=1573823 RepID=UPI003216814F
MTEPKITLKKLLGFGYEKENNLFLSSPKKGKLTYKIGYHPCVYVINNKLELYPGENKLPHVYDTKKQWLCLYYRKAREWTNQMLIADTIIPWTSEWLYHYEFWLATGNWHGKGIHGKQEPYEKEKSPAPNNL